MKWAASYKPVFVLLLATVNWIYDDMNTPNLPVNLTDAQIEEFGRELDTMRDEVIASRGERDRKYILKVIKTQRSMALGGRIAIVASMLFLPSWSHAFASTEMFWLLIGLGTLTLSLAKILENMEIGHNVLHAQWDWMKDEHIQSNRWEWDHVCPSDQWMRSHNVRHHTWTNVLGKDPDVGYGLLRMSAEQRWKPFYLGQSLYAVLLAIFFEWGIVIQELELGRLAAGKKVDDIRHMLKRTAQKIARQVGKDYIAWPLLAMVLALPFAIFDVGAGPSLPTVFLGVLAANAVACLIRNLWTYLIIFCGHFPANVYVFTKAQVENETRARWYIRQLLASCNIKGGKLFHVMSGNLSHQIEHHLFPDLPSNRYPELAPRVRALALRYGVPYNTDSLARQFGTAVWKILRLGFPGGATLTANLKVS
jgi:NADPH-dependent stearoyl-CoA 9-desaturase